MKLHELPRHRHRLFLVAKLEDRVAADHLLGLDERPVDHAQLLVGDAHLRTGRNRQQAAVVERSEEHTSELQSRENLVCRLLLEKKKKKNTPHPPNTKKTPPPN